MFAIRPRANKSETQPLTPRYQRIRRWPFSYVHRHFLWIALILAISAYGAICIRNVTDMLRGITGRQAPMTTILDRPTR
jgi:hypothetical protein